MSWSKKADHKREDVKKTKELIEGIFDQLCNEVEDIEICGSYRRGSKIVHDLDFLVQIKPGSDTRQIINTLDTWKTGPIVQEIMTCGSKKANILVNDIQIDFIFIDDHMMRGAALLHNTGPMFSNIKLRKLANEKGFKLNQYCLTNNTTKEEIYFKDEEGIYDYLGLKYVEPQKRK